MSSKARGFEPDGVAEAVLPARFVGCDRGRRDPRRGGAHQARPSGARREDHARRPPCHVGDRL